MSAHLEEIFPFSRDADADRVVIIHNRVANELFPFRQDLTGVEFAAKNDHEGLDMRCFVRPGPSGRDTGLLIVGLFVDGSNKDLAWLQLGVLPEHRRQGIGSDLLAHAHDVAVSAGRSTFTFDTVSSVPAGIEFAKAVGATVGVREHVNIVDTADLDLGMLESWIAQGPHRAPSYEVFVWEDDIPPEYDAELARLFVTADEDMPMDDLEFEPMAETAESVRERLERTADQIQRVTVVACHRESGTLAAFSELIVTGGRAETLETTLTVVDRPHRGNALGKWVKAAAITRALRRWPEAQRIVTENAQSNAAMLGINELIGFEPRLEFIAWQADAATLAAYVNQFR